MMVNSRRKTSVPSNLSQTLTLAKYELKNYWKSRRFLLLGLVVLLIGVVGTLGVFFLDVASIFSSAGPFLNLWLDTSIWMVIVLPAALLGGDAVSSEFQNKTAYSLVGNPVLRSSIYVGKWIAAFAVSLVLLGLFELVTLGNCLFYFGSVPGEFWLSFLFSALYLATALSIAFLFSSLFKKSAFPVILTGALMLIGFNIISGIVSASDIEPWFVLSYAEKVITQIFTVPYPEHITTVGNVTTYTATIPQSITIMAIYAVVSLAIGYFAFKNTDIT
jgi:ABC-2 type transport system permease protein